ncbi:MAG: S8 family serine peptidase [Clostridia bacterium]|nr:S8 family serine peptidase [Clostridia bacterium]
MKISILRRLGAAALAMTMSLQFPAVGLADTNANIGVSSLFTPQAALSEARISDNEPVRIIIELEDDPLLDSFPSQKSSISPEDFLRSSKCVSLESNLAAERRAVKSELNKSDMDITVENEYSAVFNGLSVVAQAGDLDAIREMDGVKDAFISEFYAAPEPVEYYPQLIKSVSTIGGEITHETGYTGKGTVVAILDTGLDIAHEAFGSVNSPKYTKEDIAQKLSASKFTVGKLSADVLYHSDKVPYAYDYAGNDTNVYSTNSHGTHVAGIVAANAGGTVTGVAPDAQIAFCKVFDDSASGAYDTDILSALDDMVKLGVDSINMSLGTSAGFSESSSSNMNSVYQRVMDSGINLMVSASNSYSSTYSGECGTDLPYVTNPDNSTVGSPSTYPAALSVASSNNVLALLPYFSVGSNEISYSDNASEPTHKAFDSLTGGTYNYVDCGVGKASDFEGKNLSGSIALIERGGMENGEVLTFSQKEANAKNAGAVAVIIYDNEDGELVSMSTTYAIPAVFISKKDGQWMAEQENKVLSYVPGSTKQFADASAGRMSDFSSWGVTPDLKLKPEITAPGGNIYSSVPGGKYANMSGTSMSSPHLAGAAALVTQYINEELDGLNMTAFQRASLVNALLMSTATPIRDESNTPYSPRRQGAGQINLSHAVNSKAYLLGADSGRPVLNLGEDTNGNYTFSFLVKNLGNDEIKYRISSVVETETVKTIDGVDYIGQAPRTLGSDEVSVILPQTVTLSGDTASVSGSISLTDSGRRNLDSAFPNGMFVEGFITLEPVNAETSSLTIPFMGFYGDWEKAPIFDESYYSDKTPNTTSMWLGYFNNSNGGGYKMGSCLYGDTTIKDVNKIALPGGNKANHVTAVCALLRNADKLKYTVEDDQGETVYVGNTGIKVHKSFYSPGEGFYTPMDTKGWTPFNEWGDPLPDGNYKYTVTGTLNGASQAVSFPVTIDSEAPEVVSSEIVGSKWIVKVRDNHYVQAVCATLGSSPLTGWINPVESEAGATSEIVFDLSDAAFTGLTKAKIGVTDYADNQFVSDYYSLSGAVIVNPSSISLNKTSQLMTEGDSMSLTAEVLPANASNRTVSWSSSDSDVASVTANGTVTAKAAGEAVITATTVNNLTAQCKVTVEKKQQEEENLPALASVFVPETTASNASIPFTFKLEQMKNIATVSMTFEKDPGLSGSSLTGLNGFTALGDVKWKGNTGTLMLSYLEKGAGGSLTRKQLTDVARLAMTAAEGSESLGITLKSISVSGYDESGKAVFLDSAVKTAQARTTILNRNFDLNGDGVINQLDITCCQKFYQCRSTDSDWNTAGNGKIKASDCDLNKDGIVDIADMVLIMTAYL